MRTRQDIYYNNFNLSDVEGVTVYNYNFINVPKRILKRAKLARADKSVLTSAEYSEKSIFIEGVATGSTFDEIDLAFERIKGLLQVPEGKLRVTQGGEEVNYIGTLSSYTQKYHGMHLMFSFKFLCSNPIGSSRTLYEVLNYNHTSANTTRPINIQGSFKMKPIVTVTVNTQTGGADKTIQILNSSTSQGLSVQRTWTDGDVLLVDGVRGEVKINELTTIDYAGTFPIFFPGDRVFQIIDDFSTRDLDILVRYYKQFS